MSIWRELFAQNSELLAPPCRNPSNHGAAVLLICCLFLFQILDSFVCSSKLRTLWNSREWVSHWEPLGNTHGWQTPGQRACFATMAVALLAWDEASGAGFESEKSKKKQRISWRAAAASATLATSKALVNCSSNLLTLAWPGDQTNQKNTRSPIALHSHACSLPSAVSGEAMGGFVPSSILRGSKVEIWNRKLDCCINKKNKHSIGSQ